MPDELQDETKDIMDIEMPSVPYGGAKSFVEYDSWQKDQFGAGVALELTSQYQNLLANIMSDGSATLSQKASAASALSEELQRRVIDPVFYQKETRESMLQKALNAVKSAFATKEEPAVEAPLDFDEPSGFKLIKTPTGYRWLSYSSNAYKDLDGELFTTKALEEAVDYADQTSDRGPLRIFHVPGADIGDTDFQAISDRFLIESGSFRSDELGTKAVEYFLANAAKEFQVSIGFQYKVGDEEDGVYDWLRIRERSVCPFGDAANPFTNFAFGEIGGEQMEERKVNMLNDIFGKDLASKIVGAAESKSKDLEDKGISFKSTGDLLEDLKATVATMGEGDTRDLLVSMVETYSKAAKKPMPDPEEEGEDPPKKPDAKKEADSSAQLEGTVAAIQALAERMAILDTISQAVASLQEEVKTIKEKDAASPRARNAYRATEANDNLLDPEKIKELIGADEDAPVNPARAYVEDLIQLGATR